MYILINALENIGRNKGRNILIGLVLFAIIGTSVVGLVINSTTSAIIGDYRTRFGSRVTIGYDFESIWDYIDPEITQLSNEDLQLTAEHYIAIAQSQYLMGYTMTANVLVGNDDITAVDEMDIPGFPGGMFSIGGGDFEGDERITPKFRIMGNHWGEFETGERFLINGRMPQADGEALITQDLAELNGFTVGDTITVYRSTMTLIGDTFNYQVRNIATDFIISGIYADMTEAMGELAGLGIVIQNPIMNRRNEILTMTSTLMPAVAEGGVSIESTFYLRDPAYLPYFEAEVRELSGLAWIILSTDEESYKTIVEPVEGLRSVSISFIIVVLILGAIILILLSGIAIRERKYEIGVLRAMGMKKGKVARGLLYEMGLLTAVCLVFGLAAGTIAAQPVADNLLQQQVAAVERTEQGGIQQGGMFGGMRVFHPVNTTPEV
jgi:putative ABC transport system permease protein